MNSSGSDPGASSLGFAVRRAHRAFDRALQRRLAAHGLSSGHWYCLRALWAEDGLTQRQLAQRIGLAENTTTVMVTAMLRDGLVIRRRSATDRRAWCITLSERARALQDQLLPLAMEVNRVAATTLDRGEQDRLLQALAALTECLAQDEAAYGQG